MILSYEVGDRSGATAYEFMVDLASRLRNRLHLTTDGHKAYLHAVEGAFGSDIDYAMLVKLYADPTGHKGHEGKYSPAECTGIRKRPVFGEPVCEWVSTSHVERQNLSMRMGMRSFTRLTNWFSKKLENHIHMLSLYFVHYNFLRIHKTLKCTPAMAAGVSDTLRDMEWIAGLIDARAPALKKRGPYKKRQPAKFKLRRYGRPRPSRTSDSFRSNLVTSQGMPVPKTISVAGTDERNAIAGIWVKPKGRPTARIFDPRKDRFEANQAADIHGASHAAMLAWLQKIQSEHRS